MAQQWLGVGVIGIGAMGSIHAEHLAGRVPNARLVAISDVDVAAARALGGSLGVETVYGSHAELLADSNVDAVAIAAPRQFHVPMIIDAAAAGKHVFCEKPISSTVTEADEAIAAAAKAGVVLQVGFHRHFDANFRAVHDAVKSGSVGRPQIIHLTARDPVTPGTSEGRTPDDLILETTIHDLDMARYLGGAEIESVYAEGVPGPRDGQLDGVVISLRLANGVLVTIDNHIRSAYGYDQRAEVFGTGGMIAVENETPHRAMLTSAGGSQRALPLHFFRERYGVAYIAELTAFAESALTGARPAVTGEDGRIAVTAAQAAIQSLREGRPVAVVY